MLRLPGIPTGGILKCPDWHSRPCRVWSPSYLSHLSLPHAPCWGLATLAKRSTPCPNPRLLTGTVPYPPSSPATQKKPNSQHPADGQWATVKGSHNLCSAWTTAVSEEGPHLPPALQAFGIGGLLPLTAPDLQRQRPPARQAAGSLWPLP